MTDGSFSRLRSTRPPWYGRPWVGSGLETVVTVRGLEDETVTSRVGSREYGRGARGVTSGSDHDEVGDVGGRRGGRRGRNEGGTVPPPGTRQRTGSGNRRPGDDLGPNPRVPHHPTPPRVPPVPTAPEGWSKPPPSERSLVLTTRILWVTSPEAPPSAVTPRESAPRITVHCRDRGLRHTSLSVPSLRTPPLAQGPRTPQCPSYRTWVLWGRTHSRADDTCPVPRPPSALSLSGSTNASAGCFAPLRRGDQIPLLRHLNSPTPSREGKPDRARHELRADVGAMSATEAGSLTVLFGPAGPAPSLEPFRARRGSRTGAVEVESGGEDGQDRAVPGHVRPCRVALTRL